MQDERNVYKSIDLFYNSKIQIRYAFIVAMGVTNRNGKGVYGKSFAKGCDLIRISVDMIHFRTAFTPSQDSQFCFYINGILRSSFADFSCQIFIFRSG